MVGLIIAIIVVLPLAVLWAKAIDNMKRKHPNYKGEDFLNWDGKHPDWDDNKNHTEGGF